MNVRAIAITLFCSAAAIASAQSLIGASDHLAFDVAVDPHPDAKGEYLVSVSATDLESGKAVDAPLKLAMKSHGAYTFAETPGRVMAGVSCTSPEAPREGRCVNIFFVADKARGTAACEIIVTRHRAVISRYRYGVRLDG